MADSTVNTNSVEVYENDIVMYLQLYCEEHNIDSIKQESQSVWNGALRYIKRHVFQDNSMLRTDNNTDLGSICSTFNAYNYDLVNEICDIYIDLCFTNDKEVSICGFSNLTGISIDAISSWGNGTRGTLSPVSVEIFQKLYTFREESLSDKLVTGKQNPVGVLGVLNRHYQWNMPGVSRERSTDKELTANDVRALLAQKNGLELHQIGTQLDENNQENAP